MKYILSLMFLIPVYTIKASEAPRRYSAQELRNMKPRACFPPVSIPVRCKRLKSYSITPLNSPEISPRTLKVVTAALWLNGIIQTYKGIKRT